MDLDHRISNNSMNMVNLATTLTLPRMILLLMLGTEPIHRNDTNRPIMRNTRKTVDPIHSQLVHLMKLETTFLKATYLLDPLDHPISTCGSTHLSKLLRPVSKISALRLRQGITEIRIYLEPLALPLIYLGRPICIWTLPRSSPVDKSKLEGYNRQRWFSLANQNIWRT